MNLKLKFSIKDLLCSPILRKHLARCNYSSNSLTFVPKHSAISKSDVQILQEFVYQHSKMFVITGAGLSTESGIPDYRSEGTGLYSRTNHRPMKQQEFTSSEIARKRYWARNYIGWPYFSTRQPNIGHQILHQWMEDFQIVSCLVTQNVDSLHKKVGKTNKLVELHGTGYLVNCLNCGAQYNRASFQNSLDGLNSGFVQRIREHQTQSFGPDDVMQIRPDGDIYLDEALVKDFQIPECDTCGSRLMQPDIVFFGANVKKSKVDHIYAQLENCDSILVLGSSLQVFSALRFVLKGQELRMPTAIVTLGSTRADHLPVLKITSRIGEILPMIQL